MQQAVLQHFPDVDAVYKFTHRDSDVYFTRECFDLFVESIKRTRRAHIVLGYVLTVLP